MSVKDAAARAASLATLYDAIGAELKAAKAEVNAGLVLAKEETGTRQIGAELPDGTLVAKITLVSPEPTATVADDKAFLAWVRQFHPNQVQLTVTVRPAFVDALLKEMTAAGVPRWCDKETGELHDVPGVVMQGRTAYQRMAFEKTGKDAIAAAWREGRLSLADLLGPPGLPPAA
jgi:hypothetical protein